MRLPFVVGFAAGSTGAAILVLADLGAGDVLFGPALGLLAPGAIVGVVGLVRLVRGMPPRSEDEAERDVVAMRDATPVRLAAGVILGASTTACLCGAALVAMFGGAAH